MDKKYYFMAGLPRAGSTVLSALLNQNPRIHSGPSSPVVPIMLELEKNFSNNELFVAYPKMDQAKQIIASVLPQFYNDVSKAVIIDKNRSWVNRPEYITGYFDIEPKIICPVRNLDEVVASFVKLCHDNPIQAGKPLNFIDKAIIKNGQELTDENRASFVAGPGIIGQSFDGIKSILSKGQDKLIHFVEYDDLMDNSQETMNKIYDFLEEEHFEHDFDNITNIHRENDMNTYGIEKMHEVPSKLKKSSIDPKQVLPEEIYNLCQGQEFWRDLDNLEDEVKDFVIPTESSPETKIIGA
jgi:sulfotransferase